MKLKGVRIGNNHSKRDNSGLIEAPSFHHIFITACHISLCWYPFSFAIPKCANFKEFNNVQSFTLHTLKPLGSATDEFWLFLKSLNQCEKRPGSVLTIVINMLYLFTKQWCHLDKMRYTGLA